MLEYPKEIHDLFKRHDVHKNFRAVFTDDRLPDITNKDVISESVKFSESLCSRDSMKFGLCEASTLEFETVNIPNFQGACIQAYIEYDASDIGVYELKRSAKKTNSTSLGSSISTSFGNKGNIVSYGKVKKIVSKSGSSHDFFSCTVRYMNERGLIEESTFNSSYRDADNNPTIDININNVVEVISVESYVTESKISLFVDFGIYKSDIDQKVVPVPLGMFYVQKCERQSFFAKRKVKCYSMNYLQSYKLPTSIKELKSWSYKYKENLSITMDNLLTLLFPSDNYEKHRNEMYDSSELSYYDAGAMSDESFSVVGSDGNEYYLTIGYGSLNIEAQYYENAPNRFTQLITYKINHSVSDFNKQYNNALEYLSNVGISQSDITWKQRPGLGENHVVGRCERRTNPVHFASYSPYQTTAAVLPVSEFQISELIPGVAYSDIVIARREVSNNVIINETGRSFSYQDYYTGSPGYYPQKIWGIETAFPKVILVSRVLSQGGAEVVARYDLNSYVRYYIEDLNATDGVINLAMSKYVVDDLYKQRFTNQGGVSVPDGTLTKYKVKVNEFSYSEAVEAIESLSIRSIVESYFELKGVFGHFNRYGIFETREIDNSNMLYPSESLLPSAKIYPNDKTEIIRPSETMEVIWYDDQVVYPFGRISTKYKDSTENAELSVYMRLPKKKIENEELVASGTTTTESSVTNLLGKFNADDEGMILESNHLIKGCAIFIKTGNTVSLYKTIYMDYSDYRMHVIDEDLDLSKVYMINYIHDNTEEFSSFNYSVYSFSYSYEYYQNNKSREYSLSSNYYMNTSNYAYTEAQVKEIMSAVGEKIVNITYVPAEIKFHARPDIEAGDHIGLLTNDDGGFFTIALKHEISGIQKLVSTISSK